MRPSAAVALLWLQFQFGALRVLDRLPAPWGELTLAAVWAASAAAAWRLVRRPPRWRVLATPWPALGLVVLVAAVAVAVYPRIDDRRTTGGGSDADDAAVLVARQLRDGDDPYAADTYLGNPPTTGPGSAVWALPFPSRRAYALAIVPALAATLLALRRWCGGWRVPSTAAVLLAASVPFWEAVAQGSDHLAMACALAVVVLAPWPPVVRGAASGVVATWRAAYLHLPVLLAVPVWRRSRVGAVVLAVAGVAVAVVLHLRFLSWTEGGWSAYDPVQQLVVKSDEDLGAWGWAVVVAGVVLAGLVTVDQAQRQRPDAAVLALAGIGAPLGAVAIAGALGAGDAAGWSEASYLLPTMVLASVVTARWVVESPGP